MCRHPGPEVVGPVGHSGYYRAQCPPWRDPGTPWATGIVAGPQARAGIEKMAAWYRLTWSGTGSSPSFAGRPSGLRAPAQFSGMVEQPVCPSAALGNSNPTARCRGEPPVQPSPSPDSPNRRNHRLWPSRSSEMPGALWAGRGGWQGSWWDLRRQLQRELHQERPEKIRRPGQDRVGVEEGKDSREE